MEGDTWTWNNDTPRGERTFHGRFTMKQALPDQATYKFKMGSGRDPLTLVMEGKQTHQK